MSLLLSLFKRITRLFYEFIDGKFQPKVFLKLNDEQFTDADYIIQKMIEINLNKYFPGLKIFGEEDLSQNLIPESFYYRTDDINLDMIDNVETVEILQEELVLFVDPIDSTVNFIKKNFSPVTSLVGITRNSKPFIGFVHYPLYEGRLNNSLTFFNIPSKGIFSFNIFTDEIKLVEIKKKKLSEWEFISSPIYIRHPKMLETYELFENYKSISACGLGNKAMKVVLEDTIFLSNGQSMYLISYIIRNWFVGFVCRTLFSQGIGRWIILF